MFSDFRNCLALCITQELSVQEKGALQLNCCCAAPYIQVYLEGIVCLLLYVFYTICTEWYSLISKGKNPKGSEKGSGKEQAMKAFFIMIEHALEEYYESFKN